MFNQVGMVALKVVEKKWRWRKTRNKKIKKREEHQKVKEHILEELPELMIKRSKSY